MKDEYLLIKKLNKLTNEYLQLDDDLSSCGRASHLLLEIEITAREMCMLGTNLTDDELIEFLDLRRYKE